MRHLFKDSLATLALRIFAYAQCRNDLNTDALHHYSIGNTLGISRALKLVHKPLRIPSDFRLHLEGERICAYSRYNSQIELIIASRLSRNLHLPPNTRTSFVVMRSSAALALLTLELYYLQFCLHHAKDPSELKHLNKSLDSARLQIEIVKREISNDTGIVDFAPEALNRIQYITNDSDESIDISYKNCIVLQRSFPSNQTKNNKSKLQGPSFPESDKSIQSNNQRCIVFYLDNVSFSTIEELACDKYPNISSIARESEKLTFTSSVSNWTLPAAISMISSQEFGEHKIYNPSTKPYWKIRSRIFFGIENSAIIQKDFFNTFQARFICGSNWRLKQNHGHSAVYTHSLTTPFYGDIYETIGQAFKQLDIAGDSQSFHWINIMDSHHPVHGSILPQSGTYHDNRVRLESGFKYKTGPKDKSKSSKSASDIYASQLMSIDSAIGIILRKSFSQISKENHTILLISDHGTSFKVKDDYDYSLEAEKYKAVFAIKSSRLQNNSQVLKVASPAKILELITNITSNAPNHFSCQSSDGPNWLNATQVMYPNKPYEFSCFFDDVLYQYKSSVVVRPDLSRIHDPSAYFQKLFTFGSWWRIAPERSNVQINSDQLPDLIRRTFKRFTDQWQDLRYAK